MLFVVKDSRTESLFREMKQTPNTIIRNHLIVLRSFSHDKPKQPTLGAAVSITEFNFNFRLLLRRRRRRRRLLSALIMVDLSWQPYSF